MKNQINKFLSIFLALVCAGAAWANDYREVGWGELMPEGWEPPYSDEPINHDEPFEFVAPKEIAPVVKELDKQNLRIPGYVIPLKFEGKGISEFLLVPFIGACIHVPPPPENQMVYVTLKEPLMDQELWAPVWVNGLMTTELSYTKYATAGYHMMDAVTEIYQY